MPKRKGKRKKSSETPKQAKKKPEKTPKPQKAAAKPAKKPRKLKVKKKHVKAGGGIIVVFGLLLVANFIINEAGSGAGIAQGNTVNLRYAGTHTDGTEFDSGELTVKIGDSSVISGFENALIGMKTGETKTVTIPPEEAYGEYYPERAISLELVQERDRIVTIKRYEEVPVSLFPQYFGKEAVVGDSVVSTPFTFLVSEIDDIAGIVTIEYDVSLGEMFTLPNMGWESEVVTIGEDEIELSQEPEDGYIMDTQFGDVTVTKTADKVIMTIEPGIGNSVFTNTGAAIITGANETHLVLDENHPLAGKTLIFEIEVLSVDAPESFGRPNVKMFIMSFCPFGTQAEEYAYPVQKLFGDKVDFDIHFVIYDPSGYPGRESTYCIDNVCSMHALPELTEDMRQACIQKYEPDKLWDYLMCVKQTCSSNDIGTCWETCADAKKIDIGMVEECEESEGVALMQAEKALNAEYGVRGSPAIFINDNPYEGQRTSESLQEQICRYFDKNPPECSEAIDAAAAGVAGSCG